MDRLFFRFLARLLGIFLLAALLAWLAVVPRLTQRISRNMEDALSVTVLVMVESIAAEPRQPSGQSANGVTQFWAAAVASPQTPPVQLLTAQTLPQAPQFSGSTIRSAQ